MRLVLTPERVVIAEARRLFTALSLYGFTVEAAMVNRVLPPNAGGEFLRRQREAQREALVQVSESFEGMTIRHAPMIPGEPVGVQALSAFATVVFGDADPLGVHRSLDRYRRRGRRRPVPAGAPAAAGAAG